MTPLAQALIIHALRGGHGSEAAMNGAALAALRSDVLIGAHADNPAAAEEDDIHDRIMAIGIQDMPPPTDLVALLLDALSQRLDGCSRAEAWRSIGINPNRGRDLIARNSHALDWPVWKTLRDAALAP
jgi:hypothetical protein